MSGRPITRVDITFIEGTTRSTFEEVVREIRRKFGLLVTYFDDGRDRDQYEECTVHLEGPVSPNEAELYSRLSKKARRYIKEMTAYPRKSTLHISTSIAIEFTDTTPKYRVEKVLNEIRRKFGVRVTYLYEVLGTFNADLEGSINPDEAFMLYSRSLSKTARKCIQSMDACPEELPGLVGADVKPLGEGDIQYWLHRGFHSAYESPFSQ